MAAVLLAMAAVYGKAGAQVLPPSTLRGALQGLQSQGVLPQTLQSAAPVQPQGFKNPPPKQGTIPPPAKDNREFEVIKSGDKSQFAYADGMLHMGGGVEFFYRGYHVFCDEALRNSKTNIFTLVGDVNVIGRDSVITGERVELDFDKNTYTAYFGEAELRPALVGGQIQGDVYTRFHKSYGDQKESLALDSSATTCDRPDPHFEIEADSTDVRPGRRVIFRRARIKLFGHTILRVPILSVPLDDRSYKNLPEVGQDPDEGYYIKNRYGVPLRGDSDLLTHEDYMSKLGTGLGTDFRYRNSGMDGVVKLYEISGATNTQTFSNQHQQRFKWGSISLNNDYQNNNYLTSPGSTLLNSRDLITYLGAGGASTRLGLNLSQNTSPTYKSTTQDINFGDDRNIGSATKTTVSVDWTTTSNTYSSTNTDSEQVDVKFHGDEDFKKAVASLEFQRTVPVGSNPNFFGGTDETPVVSLASDATRLLGKKFGQEFPFRTQLSFGDFGDPTTSSQITRTFFDLNFQKPGSNTGRFRADYNGDFKQGIYSDNTAEYVLNFGTALSYKTSSDTALNLHYNYLRPYGYSPLSIDQTGRTNLATADFSVRPLPGLMMGAQTGFDLLQLQQDNVAWQQFGIRTEYKPVNYFQFRNVTTYDPNLGAWTSSTFDIAYRPGATYVSFGTRYDGYQKMWSNANLFINALTIGRTKISAVLAYNGFTKQFDTEQYSFIYDLHCAEAVLSVTENNTGFRAGQQISFFLRLKALPFSSPFGIGPQGQGYSSMPGSGLQP